MVHLKSITAIFISVLFALFAFTSPAAAQEQGFDTWDEDGNSSLSEEEFTTVVNDIGYFHNWDTDSDTNLSKEEWASAVSTSLEETHTRDDYGAFGEWDKDGDRYISKEEFMKGLFNTVDEDANLSISQEEFDKWHNPEEK